MIIVSHTLGLRQHITSVLGNSQRPFMSKHMKYNKVFGYCQHECTKSKFFLANHISFLFVDEIRAEHVNFPGLRKTVYRDLKYIFVAKLERDGLYWMSYI